MWKIFDFCGKLLIFLLKIFDFFVENWLDFLGFFVRNLYQNDMKEKKHVGGKYIMENFGGKCCGQFLEELFAEKF